MYEQNNYKDKKINENNNNNFKIMEDRSTNNTINSNLIVYTDIHISFPMKLLSCFIKAAHCLAVLMLERTLSF